jgi:hypothetical protein
LGDPERPLVGDQGQRGFIWLTNLDTDKVYKRSQDDGRLDRELLDQVRRDDDLPADRPRHDPDQPVGPDDRRLDAVLLLLEQRHDRAVPHRRRLAPRTITGVVKTAGTQLHGGEMDTTTHTECYGDSDSLGLVAKFTLKEPVAHDVAQEAIDTDLEDELGALAQLEDRVHDSHPLDARTRSSIRRETISIDEVESLAQAMQVAQQRLAS